MTDLLLAASLFIALAWAGLAGATGRYWACGFWTGVAGVIAWGLLSGLPGFGPW